MSLPSVAVGLFEIGTRGLRVALDRAIPGEKLVDLALGAALVGSELASRMAEPVVGLVRSAASRLPQPVPGLFTSRAGQLIHELQRRGRDARVHDSRAVEQALDALVPLIVEELVRRVDLNTIVRDRVDLDTIIKSIDLDAIAARLDLDAIVERLDLPVLARNVIDEIDLPEIIRESSGSMASETVRGVRMHSIEADDAVARALDRVLRHRHGATPAAPDSPTPASRSGVTDPMGVTAPRGVEQPAPMRS